MLSIALGQNRRYSYASVQYWTYFHGKGALQVSTGARARCTPPPCVVHHRILLMELNHCPNFHIARSKFPEIRGLAYCTRVARARCTITPLVMHHRIALVELYQCTNFRFPSSKFSESEGANANAQCTCIARALCSLSRNGMYHRITLTELHQCTKFGVNKSKFPKTGGSLANELCQPWHAQPASYRNGNHKSMFAGEAYM